MLCERQNCAKLFYIKQKIAVEALSVKTLRCKRFGLPAGLMQKTLQYVRHCFVVQSANIWYLQKHTQTERKILQDPALP